ncbi:GNAT family N-acetyltransferase [Paenibacillus vandeheii]
MNEKREPEERMLPQLVMRRNSLSHLPDITLPSGYRLRHFESGDSSNWEQLIQLSFGWNRSFAQQIGENAYFRAERVLFICYGHVPVATATAWHDPKWGEACGYLHMVGVHPDYGGNGLGYAISLAALWQMRKDGHRQAVLETDDFRLSAIKIYRRLDFTPVYEHDNHSERWRYISRKLGLNVEEGGE